MFHRGVTFLDEWLFYSVLIFLFINSATLWIFIPVVLFGAAAIWKSYNRLWDWEDKKYEGKIHPCTKAHKNVECGKEIG